MADYDHEIASYRHFAKARRSASNSARYYGLILLAAVHSLLDLRLVTRRVYVDAPLSNQSDVLRAHIWHL